MYVILIVYILFPQDQAPTQVNVKGKLTPTRNITLEDPTGTTKVTLWRELSLADFKPGEFVKLTNVTIAHYRNEISFNSTFRTSQTHKGYNSPL